MSEKRVTILRQDDLTELCSQARQFKDNGFSLYRGVLVVWDDGHDGRVLDVLDKMPVGVLEQLLAVHERKASISFLWDRLVPMGYGEYDPVDIEPGDGDLFHIDTSIARDPSFLHRW